MLPAPETWWTVNFSFEMEPGPWEWQNHKLKGASGGLCREQGPWQGHQEQRPWQQCLPCPSTWEPASRWVGIRQEVRPCVSEFKSFLGVDLELSYWNVILLGSYNYTHTIHPLPPNPTPPHTDTRVLTPGSSLLGKNAAFSLPSIIMHFSDRLHSSSLKSAASCSGQSQRTYAYSWSFLLGQFSTI